MNHFKLQQLHKSGAIALQLSFDFPRFLPFTYYTSDTTSTITKKKTLITYAKTLTKFIYTLYYTTSAITYSTA